MQFCGRSLKAPAVKKPTGESKAKAKPKVVKKTDEEKEPIEEPASKKKARKSK